MKRFSVLIGSLTLFTLLCGAAPEPTSLRRVTLIGTNDIHGSIESELNKKGQTVGGMALLKGAVDAIRAAAKNDPNMPSGVLLLDGGDQDMTPPFQGTMTTTLALSAGSMIASMI